MPGAGASRAWLQRAQALRPEFERRTRGAEYEAKGVLFSEVLFLWSVLESEPARIVESGRARGQSTEMLARCFPDARVVSFELESGTEDAAVAERRLRACPNVELCYGDSRRRFPEVVQPGDVVVIDGPKGHRGLRLAVSTLAARRPAAVFVHDCNVGSIERSFLDRHAPGALYSDDPEFERAHADLDRACWEASVRSDGGRPHHFQGREQASYGPTYAALLHDPRANYAGLLVRLRLEGTVHNVRRSILRRIRPAELG